MLLRELMLKDAPLMYEWLSDKEVVEFLSSKCENVSLEDAVKFIENSKNDNNSIHLAIVNDDDEYMGTVSLKYIDRTNNSAELAIIVRKCAMSKGYSWYAMEEIIKKAFVEYELESVYWCVSKNNLKAIRFYEKHNFHEVYDIPKEAMLRYNGFENLKWYSVMKGDIIDDRTEVAGCKVIHIKTVTTVGAGELSFFEASRDVDFEIKRIYYISKVPEGVRRGFHAHKRLKQLLFCPYGRIQLILENQNCREEIELADPSIGVIIEGAIWREMLWLQKDSVLCVAASEFYDECDYIRDYDEFKKYLEDQNERKEL